MKAEQPVVVEPRNLQLPRPPPPLNSAKKKEYLELQRRLALHNLKKAGSATAKAAALTQKKQSTTAGLQGRKDGISKKQPPKKKPVSSQLTTVKKGKARSFSEPCVVALAKQRETVERLPVVSPGSADAVMKEMDTRQEHDLVQMMVYREREMTVAIQHQERIVEECHRELTTFTNQLTDVVSEMEELELKMDNLKKALTVSRVRSGLGSDRSSWLVVVCSGC